MVIQQAVSGKVCLYIFQGDAQIILGIVWMKISGLDLGIIMECGLKMNRPIGNGGVSMRSFLLIMIIIVQTNLSIIKKESMVIIGKNKKSLFE